MIRAMVASSRGSIGRIVKAVPCDSCQRAAEIEIVARAAGQRVQAQVRDADRRARREVGRVRIGHLGGIDHGDAARTDDFERIVGPDHGGGIGIDAEPERERIQRERGEQTAEPIARVAALIDDDAIGEARAPARDSRRP